MAEQRLLEFPPDVAAPLPGGLAAPAAPGAEPAAAECLHELIARQAQRTPERAAITAEEGCLTYAELAARAGRLAAELRRLGIGPERRVAVLLERSLDLVVTLLAVLEAGGAYVPIDPRYPAARIAFLLADSGAAVLVSRRRLLAAAGLEPGGEAGAVRPLLLDDGGRWQAGGGDGAGGRDGAAGGGGAPGAANLAYLIYTSGSTGTPKAVAIEHRSAVALARWARSAFSAEELAGVLAATSVTFDLSVFELFVPLAWGGTVVLADDALALPRLREAGRVRLVNTVPSAMAELVRTGGLPPGVTTVNLAGEALPGVLARRIHESGVERVLNLYGPSEDTTYSTWAVVARGEASPPIGRPLPGTRAHVLDAAGEPVAPGEAGELYLGGEGLARGYLGRPELTAERFVPDPFATATGGPGVPPGSRLYRTGDLVRHGRSGELEFLGRRDHQVKVRGFRIELGEVEAALGTLPGIGECAAAARDGRLVAWLAWEPGAPPLAAAALRAALRRTLPEHMVPAQLFTLPALPRTLTGKLDRRALAALPVAPGADGGAPGSGAEPRSPIEELIAGAWAEALGVAGVGRDEHFLDLGGDSLVATRIVARLRQVLGVDLPVGRLLEAGTVAAVAATLAALVAPAEVKERGAGDEPSPEPIPRVPRRPPPPLSFPQRRLWFLDQLAPGSPVYNLPMPLRIRGPLDAEALRRALEEVVRRHEALRTTFAAAAATADGEPVQVVHEAEPLPLPRIDLSCLPAAHAAAAARRLATDAARRPFDLAAGPLLRASLLRLGRDEHLLVLVCHHIVFDGWSMVVFRRELAALYDAAATAGAAARLPEPAIQYADFAAWQRRVTAGARLARELDFWRRELAGMPAELELPTDRPRPPVRSLRGGLVSAAAPPGLAADLAARCRREGITPFMLLLAVFDVLLWRTSGQADLAVGAPIANRDRAETQPLIGFFTNTLVFRGRVPERGDVRALLAAVRRTALAAYSHQDLPFDLLVEALQPQRELSRSPLFQVGMTLDEGDGALPSPAGLRFEAVEVDNGTAKFDLALRAVADGPRLWFALEHATDLFTAATARRLLAHWLEMLAAAVAAPETPVADLPCLTRAERHQLAVEWNDTAAAAPAAGRIEALFDEWVARTPEAPALWEDGGGGDSGRGGDGGRWLTYRELDARAGALAARLRALGVGQERIVALEMARSPALVVAMLATLRAGGAYAPLDPEWPAERRAWMLADLGAAAVLTGGRTAGERQAAALAAVPVLEIGPDGRAIEDGAPGSAGPAGPAEPTAVPPPPVGAALSGDHLAFVLYTSGTTGRPKGVALTHRGVLRLSRQARHTCFGPGEVVLQLAPPAFDASTLEIWGTLLNGGRLAVFAEARPSLEELGATLARHGVTSLFLTTGLFNQMVEGNLDGLAPVAHLLTGGDVLSPAHLRAALAARPDRRVTPGYGPTEVTTLTTWFQVRAGDEPGEATLIGRPLPDTWVRLLDRDGREVPIGVTGELYAGGTGLARGYLGRPELTAERFVPDPFPWHGHGAGGAGARLYRTGDLARHLPSGEIEFLGRADQQVKVRGFRIEPGEIEATLLAHPQVGAAVVVARPDPAGGGAAKRLVAYVAVRAPGAAAATAAAGPEPSPTPAPAPPSAAELRQFLRARLPEPLVPAAFVTLAELPLTANGKVDRRALPDPDAGARAEEAPGTPPRTPLEEALAAIYSEVLARPVADVHASFFDLGGHSLLATRVLTRLRMQVGLELPLRTLFAAPTIAGFAAAVQAAVPVSPAPVASPLAGPPVAAFAAAAERERGAVPARVIARAPREPAPPLSFPQRRLWFLDQLAPGSAAYNVPLPLRLAGPLDAGALARALREIVRRHEVLRTSFAPAVGQGAAGRQERAAGDERPAADGGAGGGEPHQRIGPPPSPGPMALPHIDLRRLPGGLAEREGRRLAAADALRPFDLAAGPVFRAALVALGAADHLLLLAIHHIAFDGWSAGVFRHELTALYGDFAAGRPPEGLPELPVQYADFAVWQRRRLAGERLAAELAFWRGQLAGAPQTLALPADRPRPAVQTSRGGTIAAHLPAAVGERLGSACKTGQVTPFMLLLGVFAVLLSRLSGQDDLLVGAPVANRGQPELEPLIGFFANTLVLRTHLASLGATPTVADLLAAVRETALAAWSHQDLPFEVVVEDLHPQRDLSRSPLFQVAMTWEEERQAPSPPGHLWREAEVIAAVAKFDLTLAVAGSGPAVRFEIEHNADLFDRATAARWLASYLRLVAAAVEDLGQPLAGLPMLGETERHQLAVEWNDTAAAAPAAGRIEELFDEWVARTPEAPALWEDGGGGDNGRGGGGRWLTYRELDARAGALAARLRALGVGPERIVALEMARSPALVVAMLATLRAGGAYAPLDPEWPAERRAWMLADLGAAAMLTGGRTAGERQAAALAAVPVLEIGPDGRAIEDGAPGSAGPAAPATPTAVPPLPAGAALSGDHLAFVLYTSGTTGRPKGVALTHRGVLRLSRQARHGCFGPGEVVLQLAPPAFDASTLEIWGTLLNGGRLAVFTEARPSLEELGATLARHGVTSLFLTTGLFNQMVEGNLDGLAPVAHLLTGGDVLSPAHLRAALAARPDRRVTPGYGPTEVTTFTTCFQARAGDELGEATLIGRPLPDTWVRLLDRDGREVPIGVTGELYAGGTGLARGYLGRPELTAERFVPDPFPWHGGGAGGAGARLYRTGDLARHLPSGEIEFLGRADQQVKVRGFRIEPGEIEATLLAHPQVGAAVVVARLDPAGGGAAKRLVAYVAVRAAGAAAAMAAAGAEPSPTPGPAPPSAAELRRFLRARLPEPLVPADFVTLDELPLTANGKVDRRALPEPVRDSAAGAGEYVAPRTPTEELLAGLFAEALEVERIGVEDGFFDRGGHSLLAIRLLSRLRSRLGVEVPLRLLFESPTAAAMAATVDEIRERRRGGERVATSGDGGTGSGAAADRTAPPLVPVPRTGRRFPASFAQARLWFVERLSAGSQVFSLPVPLRLSGPLDRPALAAALGELVRRQEALRTALPATAGELYQEVLPAGPVRLPEADLSRLPGPAAEREALRLGRGEMARRFDLERGPLLRVALARCAPDEHVLLLTLHHAIADGASCDILHRELAMLYGAAAQRLPSPLPELPVQYVDFAWWQREWLQGEVLATLLAAWRARFGSDLPPLALPTDRPRPARPSLAGALRERALAPAVTAAARALAARAGATPFMTLLAAFQALLARLCGQERIAVGTPVAGRDRAEIEGLIGMFVNTIVLPGDCSGDPPFARLLARVRDAALAAYSLQDLPYEKLVEALRPERGTLASPLFRAMFALWHTPAALPAAAGVRFAARELENDTAQFDLTLYMEERADGGLTAWAEYSTELFDAATIDRLLAAYEALLAAAATRPDLLLSELPGAPLFRLPAAAGGVVDAAKVARRARLTERRAQLTPERRRQLESRLRGDAEDDPVAAPGPQPGGGSLVLARLAAGAPGRTPLFCVHPAGGDALCFVPLSRRLGADQPCWALQSRGLAEGEQPLGSVEDMAALYVAELRRVQPAGPYLLAGWSFGGLAAFEMARQLAGAGDAVGLLAVIDAGPVMDVTSTPGDTAAPADVPLAWLLLEMARYAKGLWGKDLGLDEAGLAGLGEEEQLALFVRRAQAAGLAQHGDNLDQLRRVVAVFRANVRAFRTYRPKPYGGPITLFRAAGAAATEPAAERDLGWGRLAAGPVVCHEVPGEHLTLLAEPNVQVLADRLRAAVDEALAARRKADP